MSTKKTTKKTTANKATGKKVTKKASGGHGARTEVAGTLRLPKVGEQLTRTFRGKEHVVEVTADGFRHNGHDYTSLTAAALAITGYKAISGPAFFGLWKRAEVE